MYEKLDYCINCYENEENLYTLELWYDLGCEHAVSILEEFNDDDWNKLIEEIPNKSDAWMKRLAYCFADIHNEKALKILLSMVYTEDIETFQFVLTGLKHYDRKLIPNMRDIINQIIKFDDDADIIAKDIFVNFLKKMKESEEQHIQR